MNQIVNWVFLLILVNVQAKMHVKKIDSKELKCLVCKTTIKELNEAIAKIDSRDTVDVGGYRIDSKGNVLQKRVSKAKSELHLSELASGICSTMDNYVRGTWKDDGKLTVFKLIEDGQMSPKFNLVDIIQDDDLNKSLKYYCEEIIEDHEEAIIKDYLSDVENIAEAICIDHGNYCAPDSFIETEHVVPPGTENDFADQLAGLNKDFLAEKDNEAQDRSDESIIDNDDLKTEDINEEL